MEPVDIVLLFGILLCLVGVIATLVGNKRMGENDQAIKELRIARDDALRRMKTATTAEDAMKIVTDLQEKFDRAK